MLTQLKSRPEKTYHFSKHRAAKSVVVESRITINAKPETIWQLLTTPQLIPRWQTHVREVIRKEAPSLTANAQLKQDFPFEPQQIGSEHQVTFKDGSITFQMITDWQTESILGYVTIEGNRHPEVQTELEIETIELHPTLQGTEIHWMSYLEYISEQTHPALTKQIHRENRTQLNCLKRLAEMAGGTFHQVANLSFLLPEANPPIMHN